MTRRKNILAAIDRLAAAEREFLRREFLAPVLRGQGVRVRIAGVVLRLRVSGGNGWGVFRPQSHAVAKLLRPASMIERRKYLDLFPAVRLIACRQDGKTWAALPANRADARFHVEGLVPVRLAEDVQPFDTIVARFDGAQFWFDSPEERTDPGLSAYLRQELGRGTEPPKLDRPGLTAEQRTAYTLVYGWRAEEALMDERTRDERRLRDALTHAGAALRDFAEHADVYRVTYDVDGRRHTSVVRKGDLAVQTAGICLSGRDNDFDLHSLVGVLREGAQAGRIVRMPHR